MEKIWAYVIAACPASRFRVHGVDHWRRVESVGIQLAEHSGADPVVVSLFAAFHDCMRVNESADKGHGQRGAEFATLIRARFEVSDRQFGQLHKACLLHTDVLYDADVTVATCWDADRLDLGRVGIVPNPRLLNTARAKEIAHRHQTHPSGQ